MHACNANKIENKNTTQLKLFTLGLLVGLVDLFVYLSFKLATAVSKENIVLSFYRNERIKGIKKLLNGYNTSTTTKERNLIQLSLRIIVVI